MEGKHSVTPDSVCYSSPSKAHVWNYAITKELSDGVYSEVTCSNKGCSAVDRIYQYK
ncbi:MAG: hypothetical protein ACKOW9_00765 [Candidatus Paceibacterota bacterium]